MSSEAPTIPVEKILREWLDDPDVAVFCGNWAHGGVMELLPRGGAQLSGPRYAPPFDALRELRLEGEAHHVHLDLSRLRHAWYVMAPSVCYGYRPSFELRLTSADATPQLAFGVGLALTQPYIGGRLRTDAIRRYLCRAVEHVERFPDVVSVTCDRAEAPNSAVADWDLIESLLAEMDRSSLSCMHAWRAALRRRDASPAAVA